MYGIHHGGNFLRSGEIQRRLGEMQIPDDDSDLAQERMRHMVAIENLEMRGAMYSNHDFDVLAGALSFLSRKTSSHCAVPSCRELATFHPYEHSPNVRFCDHHAAGVIAATAREALATN